MYQSVIVTFKWYCMKRVISQANRQGRWIYSEGILKTVHHLECTEQCWQLLGWNKGIHNAWLLEEVMPKFGAGFWGFWGQSWRVHLKLKIMTTKVLQIRLWQWKKWKDHLKQFLRIMEECDPNAVRNLQMCRAVDTGTACYRLLYQQKASVQPSLDQFLKKVDEMPYSGTYFQH